MDRKNYFEGKTIEEALTLLGHMWNSLEHMLCKLANLLTKRILLIIC